MSEEKFPPGWDADRVKRLISHYDALDEEEQVAEDEAAQEPPSQTSVVVPIEFMPAIRQMFAQKGAGVDSEDCSVPVSYPKYPQSVCVPISRLNMPIMRIRNNDVWQRAIRDALAAVRATHAAQGDFDGHDLINWLNDHRNCVLNEIIENYEITGRGTPAIDSVFIATRQIGRYLQDWLNQVKIGSRVSRRRVTLTNGLRRDGECMVSVWRI